VADFDNIFILIIKMLVKFVNSVFKTHYFLHLLVNMHNYFNNIFLFFYSFRYFTVRKLFNFCKL